MLKPKILYMLAFILAMATGRAGAQDASLGFFELDIRATADSTLNEVAFLAGVSDPGHVSSVTFEATDSEGNSLGTVSGSIAALKGAHAWRLEDGVLYFTIETGAHAPSPYYEAKATLTPVSGEALEYRRTRHM